MTSASASVTDADSDYLEPEKKIRKIRKNRIFEKISCFQKVFLICEHKFLLFIMPLKSLKNLHEKSLKFRVNCNFY